MLAQGKLLQGRYTILRRLGEGGMGAVYAATDERFGTPVALKEIVFEASNQQQRTYLTAAFEREAKSLAKARHECIPFVRDYFSDENREYLAMELVEGDDLGKLLHDQNTPFSLSEITGWMRQLLDALDYIHNLEPPIIHRDIKPQNIKITDRKRLKLLDFGIAKSGDSTANTTHKQTFIGATLNYSPIEQILRVIDAAFREFIILKHETKANAVLAQLTDERADIFSAGSTFYHLVTNVVPVEATKRTLAVWEGQPDPLQHPSDLNSTIPRRFGDFLLKAMAIERDGRFSTAAVMLAALNNVDIEESKSNSKTLISHEVPQLGEPIPYIEVGLVEPQYEPPTPGELQIAHLTAEDQSRRITSQEIAGGLPVSAVTKAAVPVLHWPDIEPVNAAPKTEPKHRGFIASYWPIVVSGGMLVSLFIGIAVWSMLSGGSFGSVETRIVDTPTPQEPVKPSPTAPPSVDTTVQSATPQATNSVISGSVFSTPKPMVSRPEAGPQKTPRKITKPAEDPNCVYTNSCR